MNKAHPPQPRRVRFERRNHGDIRIDHFSWLQEKDNPEVIAYLEEENTYTDSIMDDAKDLEEEIFLEMKGRIQETDQTVPEKIDGYYYYARTEKGKQYDIYCRKKGSLDAPEEVYFDENALSEGIDYFDVGCISISPDHKTLAYAFDTDGDEIYTIVLVDIENGKKHSDKIEGASASIEWSDDSGSFYYVTLNESHRPYRVFYHQIGNDQKLDDLIFEEKDEAFGVDLEKSRSKKFIFIDSSSNTTSEIRYFKAQDSHSQCKVLIPRKENVEYSVDHHEDDFYILTNENAVNFKLIAIPVGNQEDPATRVIIPHDEDVTLEGFDLFNDYLAVYKKKQGDDSIAFYLFKSGDWHTLSFEEEVYTLHPHANPDFMDHNFRFSYSSLGVPDKTYEFDPFLQTLNLLKTQSVLGGFDQNDYETMRLWAPTQDGVKVPISIVRLKNARVDKPAPFHLYAYGSYGHTIEPGFMSNILSLVNRGITFGIAHVRGGAFLGRKWYEGGKKELKQNTFRDFIACAEYLVNKKYTTSEKLVIRGGSAGGLLIGNVIQERPDLFHSAIADVPFVDVVNTMLDESLPLTVTEYEVWGNPNNSDEYKIMMEYSPYDNVKENQALPHLLVTAGLNDPRVQYWEPAKWVASLRYTENPNLVLLRTNMGAGHMGQTGRYDYLREIAFRFAFLIMSLDLKRSKI